LRAWDDVRENGRCRLLSPISVPDLVFAHWRFLGNRHVKGLESGKSTSKLFIITLGAQATPARGPNMYGVDIFHETWRTPARARVFDLGRIYLLRAPVYLLNPIDSQTFGRLCAWRTFEGSIGKATNTRGLLLKNADSRFLR